MKATVYGAPWCHACHQAAEWLRARGVEVEEKDYQEAPGRDMESAGDRDCRPSFDRV